MGWSKLPKAFKIVVAFICFDLFIEIFSRVMAHTIRNNFPIFHLYALGLMLVWGLFYREVLPKSSVLARYQKWITGITMGAVVLNSIFLQGLFAFCSYSITLVQIVIIVYSLAFAFSFLEEANPDDREMKSLRQINWAVLLYNCGSLFIFMFGTFFNTEAFKQSSAFLWKVNILLNIILDVVILLNLCKIIYSPRKL